MKKKTLVFIVGLLVIAGLVLVSCAQPEPQTVEVIKTVIVTEIVEGEVQEVVKEVVVVETVEVEVEVPAEAEEMEQPVTVNLNLGTEPPTADPSLTTDTTSVEITGNIFVALTRIAPVNNDVVPYLAPQWEVGEDADANQP